MCVTVTWIRAALKVTACYIPAADCVLNINQTTKDKFKITHCSSQKVFCSFKKKQRKFNSYSEDYTVLFYIWLFNFYNRLLTEYFRFTLKHFFGYMALQIIVLNNRDYNIDQNNRDYDFCHNRAALVQRAQFWSHLTTTLSPSSPLNHWHTSDGPVHVLSWAGGLCGRCRISVLHCEVLPIVFLVTMVPAALKSLIRSSHVVLGWFLTVLMIIETPRGEILHGAPVQGRLQLFCVSSICE